MEGDVLHGPASPAVVRVAMRRQTSHLPASLMVDQAAISSSVRQQPRHKPVVASMVHTDMQGDGTLAALAHASAARPAQDGDALMS